MPDKSFSEVPRPLREMYEKGKQALSRNNIDYAVMHFEQVLKQEPGFYDCREALRAAQFKKAGASTGFFKKVLGTASASPLIAKGQLALRKDPIEAIAIAEQILNSDPSNGQAHRLLADAATTADFCKTAILSLEILLKDNTKDRNLRLQVAELYVKTAQVEKAEAIYTELMRLNPNDAEVSKSFKNLTARQTMKEGGYDAVASGTASYRDLIKDKDQAVALEQEQRAVKSEDVTERLIAEYVERLKIEPGNSKLMRNLAELHSQKKQFDLALEWYGKLKASDAGNDSSLDKVIAETKLRQIDYALEQMDPNAPDYAEKTAQIQTQRQIFKIEEVKQRVDRYPTDLQIRFEYAVLLLDANKITEAIGEFQKAQNNPQKRIQALGGLAQCFSKRNMNDSAVRTLQNALKEKLNFDDEKKDLIYQLGCIYEKMGKRDEALAQFQEIYESDISYRDVAAKVDAFYSSQG